MPYVSAARLRLARTKPHDPFAPRIDTSPGAALNNLGRQRRPSDPRYRPGVGVSTDTLYTSAWLDLAEEPFVLEVPAIPDRYYSFQAGNADTSCDVVVGSRTHGAQLPPLLLCGPDDQPSGDDVADMLTIRSTTRYLNLPGRMLVDPDDSEDLARAHEIQDRIALRPLSRWRAGETGANPAPGQRDITPPSDLDQDLGFLHELAAVLRDEIIPASDEPLVRRLGGLGVTRRDGFDCSHLDAANLDEVRYGLACGRARVDARCRDLGVSNGGWSTNLDGPRFDGDHLLRAAVARDQVYVTVPEEGIYPLARADADGDPLDGGNYYRIHFAKGSFPPVDAFWSITVYDNQGFLVKSADRHAVGDRTVGLAAADGSATIGIGPTPARDSSVWLPTPVGSFYLMMRLFCPRPEAQSGAWLPPPVERIS